PAGYAAAFEYPMGCNHANCGNVICLLAHALAAGRYMAAAPYLAGYRHGHLLYLRRKTQQSAGRTGNLSAIEISLDSCYSSTLRYGGGFCFRMASLFLFRRVYLKEGELNGQPACY